MKRLISLMAALCMVFAMFTMTVAFINGAALALCGTLLLSSGVAVAFAIVRRNNCR